MSRVNQLTILGAFASVFALGFLLVTQNNKIPIPFSLRNNNNIEVEPNDHIRQLTQLDFMDPKSVDYRAQSPMNTSSKGAPTYFGSSKVFVVQAADEPYAAIMQTRMETNQQWAQCMGYEYIFKSWNRNEIACAYTEKVNAIHDVLATVQENDWIIFLDADVEFTAKSCDALESMLPIESEIDSQPCEFIALTKPSNLNSGVVLMKATQTIKRLVQRWLQMQHEQEENLCKGPADQISLQEAVMEELLGTSYTGECKYLEDGVNRRDTWARRDTCFGRVFPAGPQGMRSVRQMCFLDCHAYPLQCRGHCSKFGKCNKEEAIFKHEKSSGFREKLKGLA